MKLTIGGLMMASRSELRDRTHSLRSHACESHTTIKMLALPVLERYINNVIIKFAFVRLIKE